MKLTTALMGAAAAVALAPAAFGQESGERGRDGQVNIIYWQAPSILNPYLSGGTKDIESSSHGDRAARPLRPGRQHGPLPGRRDPDASRTAACSEDLTDDHLEAAATDVMWSDGTPFTAEDVVFTAEYCMHPEGGCAQRAKFDGVDNGRGARRPRPSRSPSPSPSPIPYGPFMGGQSPIIQKAQFQDCLGARAPECTEANFNPIGTGPFVVTDFRPNDVIQMEANANYRDEGKPAFATRHLQGRRRRGRRGAARCSRPANTTTPGTCSSPPTCSQSMAAAGKGTPVSAFGTLVERIEINLTDPDPSLPEGERSTARAPASVPDRHEGPQGAVDGHRPPASGRDRLRPGRPADLQPGAGARALRLRQHRLPDAGHRGRQGAAGRGRLDRHRTATACARRTA